MPKEGKPLVYIVSDSTGETAEFVVKAVASQFNSGQVELQREPFLSNVERLQKVVREAAERKGMIAYTLVLPQLRQAIIEEAKKYNLPIVDLMGPMLDSFSKILPKDPRVGERRGWHKAVPFQVHFQQLAQAN